MIELLVVIAIIGILSGLIIVSMSGAQNSAKDARIKAAMDQMRSAAEIFKLNNSGQYATAAVAVTACPSTGTSFLFGTGGTDGAALCADVQSQSANAWVIDISNSSTTPQYCIQKVLATNTLSWCVDNTGYAGPTAYCDATKYTCAND